jgi:hypothetical protein
MNNDLLNIPKIQTEKLNIDSKDFRAASARRSKILTDLSQANKDVGKAFEAGIAKKYKSLKEDIVREAYPATLPPKETKAEG